MKSGFDVAIVGAGLAGMSAAVYAGGRGLETVQVGNAGALLFSSGLMDLMAVHPVGERSSWSDPWAAVAAVSRDIPGHPYAKASPASIRTGFTELIAALGEAGLAYAPTGDENCEVVTGIGTVKTTYCVPQSMLAGVAALRSRVPCLLVDFTGLREFSARGISETLAGRWPGLRTLRVDFPVTGVVGEVYAAHVARALELTERRRAFAALVRPHVRDAQAVGLPAVLGIRRTELIVAELSEALGVPVFEIPTMPTSVPGLRLKEAMERAVAVRGVRRIVHARVVAVVPEADGFALYLDERGTTVPPIKARAVVLATGRFMGGGLVADRSRVREALMSLPVTQPSGRGSWHRDELLDPRGHPLSLAGLEVDDHFRPLGEAGGVANERLYAVGTILAHQDWTRMKCGAGVAIASAFVAVEAIRCQQAELGSSEA